MAQQLEEQFNKLAKLQQLVDSTITPASCGFSSKVFRLKPMPSVKTIPLHQGNFTTNESQIVVHSPVFIHSDISKHRSQSCQLCIDYMNDAIAMLVTQVC